MTELARLDRRQRPGPGGLHRAPGQLSELAPGRDQGVSSPRAPDRRLVRAARRPHAGRADRRAPGLADRGRPHAARARRRRLAPAAHPARRRARRAQSRGRRPAASSTSPTCTSRPSRRPCDEGRLPWDFAGAEVWEVDARLSMKLLVTGGCGLHRLQLHPRTSSPTHADDRVVNLDKLTYAGNPANLADSSATRATRSCTATSATPSSCATSPRGVDAVVNFAARATSTARSWTPTSSSKTDVLGVHVLLEAVRELRVPRFLHISTDEVYGSIARGAAARGRAAAAVQPVLGRQGRRRPAGAGVLAHARRAGRDHALVEQLRALPVPGEGRPAVRHQRARRPAAAAVRRRPAGARLALRARQLRGASTWCCAAAATARSTTSAAATRSRTSRSRARSCS